ncbi:MAG: hypothetical protein AAB592_04075 [Patescibacteria group bacterium]
MSEKPTDDDDELRARGGVPIWRITHPAPPVTRAIEDFRRRVKKLGYRRDPQTGLIKDADGNIVKHDVVARKLHPKRKRKVRK